MKNFRFYWYLLCYLVGNLTVLGLFLYAVYRGIADDVSAVTNFGAMGIVALTIAQNAENKLKKM